MSRKVSKKKLEKETVIFYEQELNPSDMLQHIPDAFKNKLTHRKKKYIADAFKSTVMAYKQRYEQNYLERMLI